MYHASRDSILCLRLGMTKRKKNVIPVPIDIINRDKRESKIAYDEVFQLFHFTALIPKGCLSRLLL